MSIWDIKNRWLRTLVAWLTFPIILLVLHPLLCLAVLAFNGVIYAKVWVRSTLEELRPMMWTKHDMDLIIRALTGRDPQ